MKKKDIATGIIGLVLLGTTATGLWGWYSEHQHVIELEVENQELHRQEKRLTVLRSISKQMEEIAFQQNAISDKKREEAIEQKLVADQMRHRSEIERMNALAAQDQALASEHRAQEARLQAEDQRQIAELQRLQAEFSKRTADTLSYIALGRSLGSLASTQAQLGNTELADLLAYSSYHYIDRYKGDVFYPTVFQSLMLTSESRRRWPRHNGSVVGLAYMSDTDDRLVTASTYGEIMIHKKEGDQLQSTTLLSNSDYDFRDVYIDNGVIYAISRSGHLAIIENGTPRVIEVNNLDNPSYVTEIDKNSMLLVGNYGLAVYDKQRKMIVATRELDFRITTASRYNNMPCLFDDQNRMHLVEDINILNTSKIPVSGLVTAFASSKNTKTQAFGMNDGTVYLYDETTGKVTKLQGHLSRVSKLKVNGRRLFSASYDGTVKLWNTENEKIEAMTLINAGSWIMNFTFDNSKQYAWIGDQNGNVTEALLSVSMMADIVSKKLTRNFTTEEWNYYIGRNVPYEKFK